MTYARGKPWNTALLESMNYKYMQQHEQIENMLREESIEQNSSYIEAKHTKNYTILLEQRQVYI